MPTQLVLIRHGQSLWNNEHRFTGHVDINLSENGINEARQAALRIKEANINIEIAFTSDLQRAIDTCAIILQQYSLSIPIYKSESLKERDYGDLTGKNKQQIAKEYGEICLHKWRRGYFDRPPNGENLQDVCQRVSKYYNENIKPYVEVKNILITAHGNSLRALFVVLKLFSKQEIEQVEIPTGVPYIITFENGNIIKNEYLLS